MKITLFSYNSFSVSMAYCLGPLLGGEIAQYIGFTWLMSLIGLINIIYGIFLMLHVLREYQLQVCAQNHNRIGHIKSILIRIVFLDLQLRGNNKINKWKYFKYVAEKSTPIQQC